MLRRLDDRTVSIVRVNDTPRLFQSRLVFPVSITIARLYVLAFRRFSTISCRSFHRNFLPSSTDNQRLLVCTICSHVEATFPRYLHSGVTVPSGRRFESLTINGETNRERPYLREQISVVVVHSRVLSYERFEHQFVRLKSASR